MCGIAGIIDSQFSPEQNREELLRMLQVQHHRGPDATGTWNNERVFLGHNRLSIIDLSDAANQPMHFGPFTIVFNGEVYNYLEIKKELEQSGHVFVTRSDTEVILHAFQEWGSDCVKRFVGMWALVIHNRNDNSLFVSRDRFGIKPFYYIHTGERFYFASEIKTLKSVPLFNSELNLRQVSRGLQMGWLGYQDETYFNCIKSLPAAHNLTLYAGGINISRYWDLETGKYSNLSYEEKKAQFLSLFLDSIRLHLRSDVPVASCLSGGLDSSAIVSAVQRLNPGMAYKSFSIFYEGEGDVDERPFIRKVIETYPSVDPVYFSPDDNQIMQEFDKALYHADVPATGSSFISQYFLMKLIHENGIKVVLDGQGADEYLGGYMHTFYRTIAGMLRTFNLVSAVRETVSTAKNSGKNLSAAIPHFSKSVLSALMPEQKLYELEYKNYYPFLTDIKMDEVPFELDQVGGSRMDVFLYHLLFSTSLPSLLQYEDRNSMAFSIESRVPFLDHRIVEFAFTLFDEDKIRRGETKRIMRDALNGILPEAIRLRKDKKGFVTPGEVKWLRGPLKYLTSDIRLPDFIDFSKAQKMLNNYTNGDNSQSTMVWRLAVLSHWVQKI